MGLAAAVALGFGLTLFVLRDVYTGHGPYDFLAWNAFLAWIPYALAVVVVAGHRRGIHPYLLVLGGLVWLLFLPNASTSSPTSFTSAASAGCRPPSTPR